MARPERIAPRLAARREPVVVDGISDEDEWTAVDLTGDATGSEAEAVEVAESTLTGLRLSGAVLEGLRLTDTVLEGCDLSGALLHGARLERVEIRSCRMDGVVLSQATLRHVAIVGCAMTEANLRMVKGEAVELRDTVLRGADLGGAALPGSAITGCDLAGAELSKADLRGAVLHGTRIEGVTGGDALRGVTIGSDQLVPAAVAVFAALGIVVDDD